MTQINRTIIGFLLSTFLATMNISGAWAGPMQEYLKKTYDSNFETSITRVTDITVMPENTRHYYSLNNPWNADDSLMKINKYILDGNDYKIIKEWAKPNREKVWSHRDPKVIYGMNDARYLQKITINLSGNDKVEVLHDFSKDACGSARIGPAKGNLSNDDKYVAIACKYGTDLKVIVYDIQNNKIESQTVLKDKWSDFKWVGMSQSGNYVIFDWHAWPDGTKPLHVYGRDLKYQRKLYDYKQHGDLCVDTNGNEIWVGIGWDITSKTGGVISKRLDGVGPQIVHVPWDSGENGGPGAQGGHVSCRNIRRPGWAYVSSKNKPKEIYAVKLDGKQIVERYANHNSTYSPYIAEAHGAPNQSGTKIIFASDGGIKDSSVYDYVINTNKETLPKVTTPGGVTIDVTPTN